MTCHAIYAQKVTFQDQELFTEELRLFTSRLNVNMNFDFLLERYFINYDKLSDNEKSNTLKIFESLNKKGNRIRLQSIKYIFVFNHIVESGKSESVPILNSVTTQVLDKLNEDKVVNYFSSISTYVQDSLIYKSKFYNIKPTDFSFNLKFIEKVETEKPTEALPENEEDNNGDDFQDKGDTGTETNVADEWGFNDEGSFDDSVERNDELNDNKSNGDGSGLFSQNTKEGLENEYNAKIPQVSGPVLELNKKIDLMLLVKSDTTRIENTSGWVMLSEKEGVFNSARMDWQKRDLPKDSVYIDLKKFYFNFLNNKFDAYGTLTNKLYLDREIEGYYEYSIRDSRKRYPKFTSYNSDISIRYKNNDKVSFTGGFSLEGSKVNTKSLNSSTSNLDVHYSDDRFFTANGTDFTLDDNLIETPHATVKLFFSGDSLIHQSRRLIFEPDSMNLKLLKPKTNRYKDAPYSNSYFGVDLYGDILKWDLKADSLSISILQARSEIPAFVESSEFFMKKRFVELRGFNKFHPLLVVVGYAKKYNTDIFYIGDIKNYAPKVNTKILDKSLIFLSNMGFISYNRVSGEINILKKAKHYVLSIQEKKDYDNLLIESKTDKKNNIVYRTEKKEMVVNGVKRVNLSDKLNVYLKPTKGSIVLQEGKNFNFDGAVTAGNFEYFGKNFDFEYDNFLIHLNSIDSIQMFRSVVLPDGSVKREAIKNKITGKVEEIEDNADNENSEESGFVDDNINSNENTISDEKGWDGESGNNDNSESDESDETVKNTTQDYSLSPIKGVLYINDPKNKSGIKNYPKYPSFSSDAETFIYFNHPVILNGVYGRKFYFEVPTLKIDSTSRGDSSDINFEGQFNSGGILPTFAEKLHLMLDNTMGFVHNTPVEGYSIQENQGRFYNKLKMDGNGLRGDGHITYLSLNVESNDFIFYPDSITTRVDSYLEMKNRPDSDLYPNFNVKKYKMLWDVKSKDFRLSNLGEKFHFYDSTAEFSGEVNVKESGVSGIGIFEMLGSYTVSKEFKFKKKSFSAQKSLFRINPDKTEKPILDSNNVNVNFDIAEKMVNIKPEVQGEAALNYPYAQMRTSIPEAIWNLEENKVIMQKQDSIALKDSYFYSTRPELDSLAFSAEYAEYDINARKLNISGIPFITVADGRITPDKGKMTVLANSKLEILQNATIELDTLNAYHKLIKANVDIISRNKFEGDALLRHATKTDTFMIKIDHFKLVEYPNPKRKKEITLHTNAYGTISESDSVTIAPKFLYKGDVIIEAHKKSYKLDGYTKIIIKNKNNFDEWLRYQGVASNSYISLKYDDVISAIPDKLLFGMYLNKTGGNIEHKFFDIELGDDLYPFFKLGGKMSYNNDSSRFRIEHRSKAFGKKYNGSIYTVNEDINEFYYEGNFDFTAGFENFPLSTDNSVVLKGNGETQSYEMYAMIGVDINLPKAATDLIANEISSILELVELPSAYTPDEDFYHLIGAVEGNKTAQRFKNLNSKNYSPLAINSQIMTQSLVFTKVNLVWDKEKNAFRTTGDYLNLSHLDKNDANVQINGVMEIIYDYHFGPIFNIAFTIGDYWYFFNYKENLLSLYSSNDAFLNIFRIDGKKKSKSQNSFDTVIAEENMYDNFISDFNNKYPDYKTEKFDVKRNKTLEFSEEFIEELESDEDDEKEIKQKKKRKKQKRKKDKKRKKPKKIKHEEENIENEENINENIEQDADNEEDRVDETLSIDENRQKNEGQQETKAEKKARLKAEKLRKKAEKKAKKESKKREAKKSAESQEMEEENEENEKQNDDTEKKDEPTDNEGF